MKKIIVIFGIVFLIFVVVVYFQINKPASSTVTINSATFRVELAKTPKEQVQGLSGRESLSKNAGMLFLFDKPSYYSFWMHGMKFPLDIIFILNDKVVAVYEDLPPAPITDENPPLYGSEVAADRVLEINAGEAAKNNITVGDNVITEIK
jgi:uncharacterized membrane protein (UPF0127 family)